MPAYNAGLYISEAIESVLAQTYQNWELLIINDGSTDETASVLERYSGEVRIRCFWQQNKKQGAARNLGILHSKGDYLAFIDADDIWMPQKLQLQMDVLSAYPGIDLLFCQGYTIDGSNTADMNVVVKHNWTADDLPAFIVQNQIPVLSVITKKAAVIAAGAFDERPEIQNAEDYHLWLKMLINGSVFKSTADRLFKYRVHYGQSTYQNSNLNAAIFYMLEDVFYHASNNNQVLKAIIAKIKFQLFNIAFHEPALRIIVSFLKLKRKKAAALLLRYVFFLPLSLQQKIAFKLVSRYA